MSIAEKLVTIAENEQKVYDTGYDKGYDEGLAYGSMNGFLEGYYEGKQEGYEEGKQAEYDAFWNSYQQNGNRTAYEYGFSGVCWNSEIFKPKHLPMQVVNGSYMFLMFDSQLKKASVAIDETIIDFTNATNVTSMFQNANISVIKMNVIPTKLSNMNSFVYMNNISQSKIKELKLGIHETMTFNNYSFQCLALETIFFVEGSVIGTNISFHYCKNLTLESVRNIISVLKDYSGTSTTRTLTLHADVKLTDSEKAIATQKGWSIAQ